MDQVLQVMAREQHPKDQKERASWVALREVKSGRYGF